MTKSQSFFAMPAAFKSSCIDLGPGIGLSAILGLIAALLQQLEGAYFGRAGLEALVIAILLGTVLRSVWQPSPRWQAGIEFSAKYPLELAIVFMGGTISGAMIAGIGSSLVLVIIGIVISTILMSYGLGRLFGLPHRMAVLIACGNSICGNSAIAAVAPVIGAESRDVAASIAFTAILGVAVVLGLPLLAIYWHMTAHSYGVLAGLTVYAVPQVLAATAPISSLSAQIGTLVKLVRVLMLGPIVLAFTLITRWLHSGGEAERMVLPVRNPFSRIFLIVPWFILGFLLLIVLKSAGALPVGWIGFFSIMSNQLTIMAMAALGLGVDIRVVAVAGPRVIAVVTLSLIGLTALAMMMIFMLGIE